MSILLAYLLIIRISKSYRYNPSLEFSFSIKSAQIQPFGENYADLICIFVALSIL